MRSAFFGFHVASTGLFTARSMINVTSHNIANAEIPGFSRQVALARANNPLSLRDSRGMYGTGSQVTGIIQIRDRFLDKKFWGQRQVHGRHTATNTHLNFIETVFNQLPDAGVLRTFGDFFSRMSYLTTRAQDATFRTNVITGSDSLADQVSQHAAALQRQQADVNREVADVVHIMNSLGSQIATLNKQINIFERDGSNANDLRDQRALLIDELSQYVNVQVEERNFADPPENPHDRRMTVMINGYDFVNHDLFHRLELVARNDPFYENSGQSRNFMDVPGLYDIRFAGTRASFNIYSPSLGGQLRGLIDIRDGNGGQLTGHFDVNGDYVPGLRTNNFKGIPFYMNQLNYLVRTFSRAMNEGRNSDGNQIQDAVGHIFGYNINGDNLQTMFFTFTHPATGRPAMVVDTESPEHSLRRWMLNDGTVQTSFEATVPANVARDEYGNPLFTLDYSLMTAFNFIVNPALTADGGQDLLAASSVQTTNIGEANNDVIHGFLAIGQDRTLFSEGRLLDFIIATSNHLAVDNQQAQKFRLSYEEISMQTHNHRLSIKGVDTNEEMMNLVRFQQLFVASSRLVNVLDSIYDTLINRLGNM